MKNEKEMLEELLVEAAKVMDCPQPHEVAEYLLENGVKLPPVKIGQTVYSAISPEVDIDEHTVTEWKVKGILCEENCYYAENSDGEFFVVGSDLCKLTRRQAESAAKGAAKK